MKQAFFQSKIYITIIHIAIIAATLCSSEPFDRIDISPWVVIIGLGLLLIIYITFRAIKLEYVPTFHILIALCVMLIWIVALASFTSWSNLSGWGGFVYLGYAFFVGIFLICLLVMNLVVHIIKRSQAKKMHI